MNTTELRKIVTELSERLKFVESCLEERDNQNFPLFSPRFQAVTEVVAEVFGVPYQALIGRSREARLCEPRQVAMALCYGDEKKKSRWESDRASTTDVAMFFSGRHHAMVGKATLKVQDLRETDTKFDERVRMIEERLKGKDA